MFKRFVNLELSRNQQTIINIVAAVLNMLVTTLISFVLSPYIVKHIGVEANGFVGLAQNFLSYAVLITTALNSMGSRFLIMTYYNGELDKFRRYYSSLLFANLVLGAVLGILAGVCVWKLEVILEIPPQIVSDVKWLFALIFANFVMGTMITAWSSAPFLKNRLYLNSLTIAASAGLRALMILGLFLCLEPTVSFVGVATLISGAVTHLFQMSYKHILFPELRARLKDFSWPFIWELISSGIWNTLSSLGHVLSSGLDLLITNMFISANAMGILALSHTIPTFINTLNETLANSFVPTMMMSYAKKKTDELAETITRSAKIISVICSLPLGFLMVYGREFFSLWQPTQDAQLLHRLSVIIIFGRIFFTGMQPLFSVFTVVNKVRENAVVTIVNGFASVGLMFLLLKFTDLGIYAIAGSSVICCFIKNIFFVIPFSAKYLGLKPTRFYQVLVPSMLCCGILYLWGILQKMIVQPTGWMQLIVSGAVFAFVGLCLTCFMVLNRRERKILLDLVKSKIKR